MQWLHSFCMHVTSVHAGSTTIFSFTTRPHNLSISQYRKVEFWCSTCSTLIPTFLWNFTRKDSTEAEIIADRNGSHSADYSIVPGQRSQALIITDVQWRHEGVYTCIVSSNSHQIKAEANLYVLSKWYYKSYNINFMDAWVLLLQIMCLVPISITYSEVWNAS